MSTYRKLPAYRGRGPIPYRDRWHRPRRNLMIEYERARWAEAVELVAGIVVSLALGGVVLLLVLLWPA